MPITASNDLLPVDGIFSGTNEPLPDIVPFISTTYDNVRGSVYLDVASMSNILDRCPAAVAAGGDAGGGVGA